MAKPILIVRLPVELCNTAANDYNKELKESCPDYNVIFVYGKDAEMGTFEIITEHNQPQGLSV
jgi:hypothetical protein